MSFKARIGKVGDEARLEDIEQASFSAEAYGSDVFTKSKFKYFLKSHASRIDVAIDEKGDIWGYVILSFRKGSQTARLYSIAVHPKAQGKGVGTILLDHAVRVSKEKKAKRIVLEVRKDNTSVIKKYEKQGYRIYKTLPAYYEDKCDGLKMELKL